MVCIAEGALSRGGLRASQKIERDIVSDHQHGHVDDRDDIGSAELPRKRGQTAPDGVVVGGEEIDGSDEIEGYDEEPEERSDSYREKRQDGQHSSCKVTIAGKGSKTRGTIGTDDTPKEED